MRTLVMQTYKTHTVKIIMLRVIYFVPTHQNMCPQGAICANFGGASRHTGQCGATPRSLRTTASTRSDRGGRRSGDRRAAGVRPGLVGVLGLVLLLLLPLMELVVVGVVALLFGLLDALEPEVRTEAAPLSSQANGLESRTTNLKLGQYI
jgi:hypothetical protein